MKWKNACQSKSGIKSPTSRLKVQPAMSHVQRRPESAPPLVPRVAPGLPLFLALVCKCVIRTIDRTLPWIAIPGLGSIIQPFGSHSAAALFVITGTAGPTRQPFGRTSQYGTRVKRDLVKSRVWPSGETRECSAVLVPSPYYGTVGPGVECCT